MQSQDRLDWQCFPPMRVYNVGTSGAPPRPWECWKTGHCCWQLVFDKVNFSTREAVLLAVSKWDFYSKSTGQNVAWRFFIFRNRRISACVYLSAKIDDIGNQLLDLEDRIMLCDCHRRNWWSSQKMPVKMLKLGQKLLPSGFPPTHINQISWKVVQCKAPRPPFLCSCSPLLESDST